MIVLLLGAAGVALLSGGADAQGQAPPQQKFIGRADLVLVDVIVTDRQHRPVRGLTAADFIVKEDGVVRPIVAFEATEGGRGGTLRAPSNAGDAPAGGRREDTSVAVLVDEQHLTQGQAAAVQPALRSIITALSVTESTLTIVAPVSKISIAARLPFGAARMVAATFQVAGRRTQDRSSFPIADAEAVQIVDGDPRALARVVARYAALNPDLSEGGAVTYARARALDTADAARRSNKATYGVALLCLDWLKEHPGRRHLVIISAGIARDGKDDRYKALVARSLELNVPVHFVDARTLAGGQYQDMAFGPNLTLGADAGTSARADASAGLDQLAADTGGSVVGGTNDLDEQMMRLLDSMSSYYVLAYQPPANAAQGFRSIEVTTARNGVLVRARRGYQAR